ncbi:unnamed protein product [Brassica napus]|uniref:(rape) hypothetical protein n=1 Tax=Brassica napus TaxID=3708 RepID=A0A816M5W9_BRANA|nr:unnamed protein product [Brassica napus]
MDDLQGSRPYRTESFILPIGDFEGDYFLRFLTAGNLAYSVVLTADLKPRLVELRRRSVTDGVIGDHIFSDYRPSPLLLAYNGGKEHKFFKEVISKQVFKLHSLRLHRRLKVSRLSSVINFVHKDYAEMFPRWDFDVEDPAAENIIKKEVSAAETESGVKEESARPRKKARKEASVEASKVPSAGFSKSDASTSVGGMTKELIEKSFKDIADVMRDGFGMCLKEIKLLGDRMEAVEKKSESVNGAKAGQNDSQEPSSSKDLSLVIANEPEEKPPEQSGEPSLLVLDKEVPTDSDLQKGETRRQKKRNAAMVHVRGKSERARKLAASQQTPFNGNNTAKVIIPNKRVGQGYDLFAPFDKKMSKWSHHYPEFKSDEGDINGLGRRLPGGAWNYSAGIVPSFCQSMKVWGLDVDDIYAPVNFRNEHWIVIWISIPKRHIVVWDSILTHIRAADLDVLMEPFVNMVPYLLVECSGSDEERVKHTLEPYTYERVTVGVPQCRAGDCGVFALKYIECHALGMSFPPALCNKNSKAIREKMALDIFKETPEGHAKENEDNVENLATYDQQG